MLSRHSPNRPDTSHTHCAATEMAGILFPCPPPPFHWLSASSITGCQPPREYLSVVSVLFINLGVLVFLLALNVEVSMVLSSLDNITFYKMLSVAEQDVVF